MTLSARFAISAQPLRVSACINPLNAKLNPICHLLALLGAHHILHISGVRVKQPFPPHSSPRSETLVRAATNQLNDAQHRHVTKVTSIFASLALCGPTNQRVRDQWRTEGGLGVQTPTPKIPKALQTRAKLNPIVKTVKNC